MSRRQRARPVKTKQRPSGTKKKRDDMNARLMQSSKTRQKKRGGKKRSVPSSSTPQSSSHLGAFFANYAPRFQYDATQSASQEFYRLCDESGWEKEDSQRQEAHQDFKDALVKQFNAIYGTDENALEAWQNLCDVVRIRPIPDDLHACREAIRYSFINLVDLVDTKTTGVAVHKYGSESALSEYTISTGKYFPRENAYAGGLLHFLLRHILHPRAGYDASGSHRTEGGRGGHRRRGRGRR